MLASGNAGKFWRSTRVAQQLGIDYPIIQAPFGPVSGPAGSVEP